MSKKIICCRVLSSVFLGMFILSGCAAGPPRAKRYDVQWAESECYSYDCYMERMGRNKHESSVDVDGNQNFRWYMSVRKTRPLEYGEVVYSGMHYKYYYEDCWFTAVFDPDGKVLETEWDGPGCWGRGN